MAIHRKVNPAAKSTNAPAPKAPAKPRQRKPAVADVPKVAARVVKDAEIRIVRNADRAMTDVTHTAQVYRDMERDGTDRLQALVTSYGHLFQGAEEIQQRMWDLVQQSIGTALSLPGEFAQCTSFTEIAEKQQDLVQGFLNHWVTASHTLLTASRRVVDRAIRPLES